MKIYGKRLRRLVIIVSSKQLAVYYVGKFMLIVLQHELCRNSPFSHLTHRLWL